MPDTELDTSSVDTTPLSISEAALAFAGTTETEEPDEGQPEVEDAPEGEDQAEDQPEPDEDEGEDTEGDPEDEGQAEDSDEAEQEPGQGRFAADDARVRITNPDGTTSFVTVAELKQGNLRDRDYRQKTMALSEEVKSFRAQSDVIKQREDKVAQQAEYVSSLLQSIIPPAPDPAMADPNSDKFDLVAYNYQRATREQWLEHVNYLNGEQQKRKAATAEEAVKGKKERADQEWSTLLSKVPEFKDEKRVEAFVKQSFSTGEAYGFTRAEIAETLATDHRMVLVLKDAMRARRMDAAKAKLPQKLEGKPPVQKGGQRHSPGQIKARDERAAMDRLNTSGSLKDGIAALLALEGKG